MKPISEVSILTSVTPPVQTFEVKSVPRRKQGRVNHPDITVSDISPHLRALGRHTRHCSRKGRSVHIPAMRGSEWGAFLRALEVSRAIN